MGSPTLFAGMLLALLISVAAAVVYRRADRREKQARVELQRALRLRDDFIAIAAHELRTPAAVIRMQAEILLRRPEQVQQQATAMRRVTMRLCRIVDDLLDVSLIREGRLVLEPSRFDLVDAVQQVVTDYSQEATHQQCTLTLHCDHVHVVGTWDRDRIEQALTNLLINALKYGQSRPVEVGLKADREAVLISVSDNGPGIAPEDLDRVFGRFERADPDRKFQGTGLGLWIAQAVIDAMGGKILATSKRGLGTTFTIVLPRNASSLETTALDDTHVTG